ncbi:MAG: efflux RND transporter periplasmic adaptor subunit [Prolixibacteraceae bacterium]|jgi:membrane fusion protein (multidrug efflux system)|nr:efflux RND transporter periplasmic adaptor subunit [Prolixibacteraceae bacterium]
MKTLKPYFIAFCCLAAVCSCKPNSKDNNFETGKISYTDDTYVVITAKAQKGVFYNEFENNGKLEACEKADILFEQNGKILSVNVHNGKKVKKGDLLATVESTQQQLNYDMSERNLEKSRLYLEENLINQGYSLADSISVPAHIMKMAIIRSGYLDAKNSLKTAHINLEKCSIKAPFDGIIADLEAKPFNETSLYKKFCTLINDNDFEVSFSVLEMEMSQLQKNMAVEIIPFSFENDTTTGILTEINPKVEENGMVKVKALIKNTSGILSEGMNVKVMIKKPTGAKVFVPKEAVTLRQERNVVFVCKNDTAHWRYVETGETNSTFTVINSNIGEGEEVIIEGNFNLAHLSPVNVIERK